MSQSQVATVYADALLELAGTDATLEEIEQEILEVNRILFSDKEVREFVLSPMIGMDDKESVLNKALHGQVRELVSSYIGLLNQKNRLEFLPEITEVFSKGVDRVRGRRKVVVTSREPLVDQALDRIRKKLENKYNVKVLIENQISDKMIGGFKIQMGDILVDASIRTKLSTIKQSLLSKKITVGAIYEN
jgi:F-type H+-transporting ATPase subunit delta